MNIAQFLKLKGSAPSELEEAAYEVIAFELASKDVKPGLWTKALADAAWDEPLARSLYVRMRHQQLLAEVRGPRSAAGVEDPYREAREYGLSQDDLDYLGKPIKAIRYLSKYGKSESDVSLAIAKKKLTSVLKNGVLWVSDKPF
jgi:hypothetical protein